MYYPDSYGDFKDLDESSITGGASVKGGSSETSTIARYAHGEPKLVSTSHSIDVGTKSVPLVVGKLVQVYMSIRTCTCTGPRIAHHNRQFIVRQSDQIA